MTDFSWNAPITLRSHIVWITASTICKGAWSQIKERLVTVEETIQLVHHQFKEVRIVVAGEGSEVRREKDVGQIDDFAIGRNRFRIENIQSGGDVSTFEACNERVGINNWSTRDID